MPAITVCFSAQDTASFLPAFSSEARKIAVWSFYLSLPPSFRSGDIPNMMLSPCPMIIALYLSIEHGLVFWKEPRRPRAEA